MSSSRLVYSSDKNLKEAEELAMMKKVLEPKLIQENNIATLQNTQTNVNCLGDGKKTLVDQNTLSGAVQKEVACSSCIEDEIPEVVTDAESNKATAGSFGIILLFVYFCLLNNYPKTYTDVKMQANIKAIVITQVTWIFFAMVYLILSLFEKMNCCRSLAGVVPSQCAA